ncbi:endolytic transglycosylase MltG [[Mycobacterium] nativiensis]|uniref:Endolytic murein transglycosylase n=1 Tax=[Mycobacterium] nativiensis TaxID=2855503 RepID=A0ABU5XVK5_9MYCO|nr:endolytic transglycosylase MltG [Mycolicibacter sp. MYC340]MEB3031031.1 endolytic transglycosylase MltG [Mycolicibacter sp. MYC340]
MSDQKTGRKAKPVAVGPPRRRMSRTERARDDRRQRQHSRRRRLVTGLGAVLVTMLVIAGVFLGSKLWHSSSPVVDFTGEGGQQVLIEVHEGDYTTAVAEALLDAGVIANVGTFLEAAQSNPAIAAIQPGFYRLKAELPAATAVQELVDPGNRVGKLVIPEGRQLDDITDLKTNAVTPGVFTLIAEASCLDLNGDRHCLKAQDLRRAAETETPEALSVPGWAVGPVTKLGRDHRRIEGLITAGTWNVDPTAPAATVLSKLIVQSAAELDKSGLSETAHQLGMSPYELLVVASLVQREALPHDFAKVARVIDNRLSEPQRLEFDSTVNYPLDRQEVATTDADRAKVTPWNTYASDGLPATPICSPGTEALHAAEHPEPGDWLYFVTIDDDGTTLFTHSYQQHLNNIELALDNGVLDSSR